MKQKTKVAAQLHSHQIWLRLHRNRTVVRVLTIRLPGNADFVKVGSPAVLDLYNVIDERVAVLERTTQIIVRPFLSLRSKYIKRVLENVFGRNLPSHLVEINIQGGDPKVSDFQRRFGHHFLNFLGGSEERRVGKECRSGWSQREAENRER